MYAKTCQPEASSKITFDDEIVHLACLFFLRYLSILNYPLLKIHQPKAQHSAM